MSALFPTSAGCATLTSRVLSRWTGWVAYAAAVANLAAPSILMGPDYRGVYTATGYVTMVGEGALVVWSSVSMIVMRSLQGDEGDKMGTTRL